MITVSNCYIQNKIYAAEHKKSFAQNTFTNLITNLYVKKHIIAAATNQRLQVQLQTNRYTHITYSYFHCHMTLTGSESITQRHAREYHNEEQGNHRYHDFTPVLPLVSQWQYRIHAALWSVTLSIAYAPLATHRVANYGQTRHYPENQKYITYCIVEPRPQTTRTENFTKFGHVIFETCNPTDRQTSDTLIAILCIPTGVK